MKNPCSDHEAVKFVRRFKKERKTQIYTKIPRIFRPWTSFTGCLIAIGQQSGKPDRASRANEPMRYSRANSDRAGQAIGPVGPIRQPEQSGKPVRISSPRVKPKHCLVVKSSNRARLSMGPFGQMPQSGVRLGSRSGKSGKCPNRASRAWLSIGPVRQMQKNVH